MQLTCRRNYYERSFSIRVIRAPWRVWQLGVFVPFDGAEDERDHCQRLAQTHWICHYPTVELGWWMWLANLGHGVDIPVNSRTLVRKHWLTSLLLTIGLEKCETPPIAPCR